MRRLTTCLKALFVSVCHISLVETAGFYTSTPSDIHERYGTAVGVESICYTYVTTLLVTVEPEQVFSSANDECSSHTQVIITKDYANKSKGTGDPCENSSEPTSAIPSKGTGTPFQSSALYTPFISTGQPGQSSYNSIIASTLDIKHSDGSTPTIPITSEAAEGGSNSSPATPEQTGDDNLDSSNSVRSLRSSGYTPTPGSSTSTSPILSTGSISRTNSASRTRSLSSSTSIPIISSVSNTSVDSNLGSISITGDISSSIYLSDNVPISTIRSALGTTSVPTVDSILGTSSVLNDGPTLSPGLPSSTKSISSKGSVLSATSASNAESVLSSESISTIDSILNTISISNSGPISSPDSILSTGSISGIDPNSNPNSISTIMIGSSAGSVSSASASYGSSIGPISSPVISQLPGPSTSSTRTTATAPVSSLVILSVEIQAFETENITRRGIAYQWPELEGRQEDSPDTPDPDLSSGFVGNTSLQNPDNCTDANLYIQSRGQLRTSGRPLSVNLGVDYINIVDFPGGSIATLFTVINGILVWENVAFVNGTARFCQSANGTVFALFTQVVPPFDCTIVNLVVYTGELNTDNEVLISSCIANIKFQ